MKGINMNTGIKTLFIFFVALLMTGCKLALLVTANGDVLSSSGTRDCAGGRICEFDVTAAGFSETFTATARPGYEFSKWQAGDYYQCANSENPVCTVSNGPASDDPLVESIRNSILDTGMYFYAKPIFTFVGIDTDDDGIKDHLDVDDDNDGIFDLDDACPLNPDLSCGADTIAVDGKIWYQPDLFIGVTYQDITDVCGSGICNGLLNGHDLTNWTWASASDLNALMAYYETISDQECAVHSLFADGWRETNSFVAYFNITNRLNGMTSGLTEFYYMDPGYEGASCYFAPQSFATTLGLPGELLIATRMGGFFYRTP